MKCGVLLYYNKCLDDCMAHTLHELAHDCYVLVLVKLLEKETNTVVHPMGDITQSSGMEILYRLQAKRYYIAIWHGDIIQPSGKEILYSLWTWRYYIAFRLRDIEFVLDLHYAYELYLFVLEIEWTCNVWSAIHTLYCFA